MRIPENASDSVTVNMSRLKNRIYSLLVRRAMPKSPAMIPSTGTGEDAAFVGLIVEPSTVGSTRVGPVVGVDVSSASSNGNQDPSTLQAIMNTDVLSEVTVNRYSPSTRSIDVIVILSHFPSKQRRMEISSGVSPLFSSNEAFTLNTSVTDVSESAVL